METIETCHYPERHTTSKNKYRQKLKPVNFGENGVEDFQILTYSLKTLNISNFVFKA